jgi:hypothetical protein
VLNCWAKNLFSGSFLGIQIINSFDIKRWKNIVWYPVLSCKNMYPNYVLFYFTLNFGYSAYASHFLICVKIKEKSKTNCVRQTFRNRTECRLIMTIEYRLRISKYGIEPYQCKDDWISSWTKTRGIEPCLCTLPVMSYLLCELYGMSNLL